MTASATRTPRREPFDADDAAIVARVVVIAVWGCAGGVAAFDWLRASECPAGTCIDLRGTIANLAVSFATMFTLIVMVMQRFTRQRSGWSRALSYGACVTVSTALALLWVNLSDVVSVLETSR